MSAPRALLLPEVLPCERPEKVCLRLVVGAQGEKYDYLETLLDPAEARRVGIDLMKDAERAETFRGQVSAH